MTPTTTTQSSVRFYVYCISSKTLYSTWMYFYCTRVSSYGTRVLSNKLSTADLFKNKNILHYPTFSIIFNFLQLLRRIFYQYQRNNHDIVFPPTSTRSALHCSHSGMFHTWISASKRVYSASIPTSSHTYR